jgi:hypothetical protein
MDYKLYIVVSLYNQHLAQSLLIRADDLEILMDPMIKCEKTRKCSFYNDRMEKMPAAARIFRNQFCNGNSSECAWHYAYSQLERKDRSMDNSKEALLTQTLSDLLPNQLKKVKVKAQSLQSKEQNSSLFSTLALPPFIWYYYSSLNNPGGLIYA